MTQRIRFAIPALIGLVLLIQLVPYGRNRSNPDVVGEPDWDRSRTRELFFRACRDCHSNATKWPLYSAVAPISWLVQRDVEEGRSHFNVSEWGRANQHAGEAAKRFRDGEMPPWFYLLAHSEAKLSEADATELMDGLIATFWEEGEHSSDSHDHSHDHDGDH